MITNFITGLVNFFSFLSLTVTTSSVNSFLGATFILASSIFLEALTLQNDSKKYKSKVIIFFMGLLYLIGITGFVFSIAGLARFLNVYFNRNEFTHIIVASFSHSIYYVSPTDINRMVIASGITATAVPFCLTCREAILQKFRKTHYNLEYGLYGK